MLHIVSRLLIKQKRTLPCFARFLEKIAFFTRKSLKKHFFTNSRFTVFLHSNSHLCFSVALFAHFITVKPKFITTFARLK